MLSMSSKKILVSTTAVIGLLALMPAAQAADTTVSATVTGPVLLGAGNNLIVKKSGDISGGTQGVFVDTVTVGSITSHGSIAGTTYGIESGTGIINGGISNTGSVTGATAGISLTNASTLAGGISNGGTVTATAGSGIEVTNGSDLTGGLSNTDAITGTTAGLIVTNGSTFTGDVNNKGTITATAGSAVITNNSGYIDGDFINSGTLSGSATGLYLTSPSGGTSIKGMIYNSGTIGGTADNGIRMGENGNVRDGLTNTKKGTIEGGVTGLLITNTSTLGGPLENAGQIIGGTGDGVQVSAGSTITGNIHNSGAIEGGTNGLNLTSVGAPIAGDIINEGSISGGNGSGIVLASGSSLAAGHGLVNAKGASIFGGLSGLSMAFGGTIDSLENDGTMSGDLHSIDLHAGGTVTNDLTNNGLLDGQVSIGTGGVIGGNLINNGRIVSAGDTALLVDGAAIGDGSADGIVNNGTIAGVVGLAVNAAAPVVIFNNAGGSITGTDGTAVSFTGLTDTARLVLNGGAVTGDIVDDDPTQNYSTVEVAKNFSAGGDIDVGTIEIDAGISFDTHGHDAAAFVFTNDGTAKIGAGDTLTAATVTGSLTNTFTFGVSGAAAGALVTAGALDLTDTTLTVAVGSTAPTDGAQFKIVDAASITGGPGATPTAIQDNSYLWDFTYFNGTVAAAPTDASDLFIEVAQAHTVADTASNRNNAAAGDVLMGLSTNDANLQAAQAAVNGAGTAAGVNAALASVLPDTGEGILTGITDVANSTFQLINAHAPVMMADAGASGLSAGSGSHGQRAWVQGFGQYAKQDARSDGGGATDGYRARTYGAVIGADNSGRSADGYAGFALSYGNTDVDAKNVNQTSSTIDSYQASLYGEMDFDAATYLRGLVAYSYNDISTTRRNVGAPGVSAYGDTHANQYWARAEAGRAYKTDAAFGAVLTPAVIADYMHYAPAGYTETGAGGAGLTVRGESLDKAELGATATARWDIKSDGTLWQPSVHAGYRYDLIGDRMQTTAGFTGGGASFAVEGASPARGTVNAGVGLSYLDAADLTVSAAYDYERKEDFSAHAGVIRVTGNF